MIAFYQGWLERLQARGNASAVWRLCRTRILQSAIHLLFLSAFILSSRPIHDFAYAHVGQKFSNSFDVLFWSAFGILVLAPIIVLWRNLEALAMIIAEGATQAAPRPDLFRKVAQTILKCVFAFVFFGWLLLLIPVGRLALWALVIAAVAILIWAPVFWRRLVHLHSKIEVDLRSRMKAAATLGSSTGLPGAVLERPQQWNLQIDEVIIPFASEHAGRRISDLAIRKNLGCSIMTIDRQGFLITNPTADERLYAGDRLLIVGSPEQLSRTEQLLRGSATARPAEELEHIAMETIDTPDQSAALGRTLAELNLPARFGIQICGIERDGARLLVPSSDNQLRPGDKLLVLGPHEGIQALRNELTPNGS